MRRPWKETRRTWEGTWVGSLRVRNSYTLHYTTLITTIHPFVLYSHPYSSSRCNQHTRGRRVGTESPTRLCPMALT